MIRPSRGDRIRFIDPREIGRVEISGIVIGVRYGDTDAASYVIRDDDGKRVTIPRRNIVPAIQEMTP